MCLGKNNRAKVLNRQDDFNVHKREEIAIMDVQKLDIINLKMIFSMYRLSSWVDPCLLSVIQQANQQNRGMAKGKNY